MFQTMIFAFSHIKILPNFAEILTLDGYFYKLRKFAADIYSLCYKK